MGPYPPAGAGRRDPPPHPGNIVLEFQP
jgi:hypothetical protein